ncbi:MAG TPA: LysM peptidoglycan-binding domain-containing protein, partial [Acidimicrobiales bacterium]|nr:LysM peptidoglycan-binding domain-containing protein [Acidimicrobiales bacterium]
MLSTRAPRQSDETTPSLDGVTGHRPVQVVIRRQRVLSVLLAGAGACAVLGAVPALRTLWWGAGALGLLAAGYLGLVAHIHHLQVRREMAFAFGRDELAMGFDWTEIERELHLSLQADDRDPIAVPVQVRNRALVWFLMSYALGWVLTPVVVLIRLVRGDLSDLERHGVIDRIVRLQQYGRSRSLRLLTVMAAATVGVTAVGSATPSAFASPKAPAAAMAANTYTVRRGDTLGAIAARYGTTIADLVTANHLANPNLIYPGQVLTLATRGAGPSSSTTARPPAAPTYTVARGDTLGAIAARYGTTVAALVTANHIANPNLIYPGQVLALPGGAAPTPQAAVTLSVRSPGSGYVNPFLRGSWTPARTDEGVDWIPNVPSPVVAIGDGVVTYSSMRSGWPGGAFITYRLSSGS